VLYPLSYGRDLVINHYFINDFLAFPSFRPTRRMPWFGGIDCHGLLRNPKLEASAPTETPVP
jgi:hypothetical protein